MTGKPAARARTTGQMTMHSRRDCTIDSCSASTRPREGGLEIIKPALSRHSVSGLTSWQADGDLSDVFTACVVPSSGGAHRVISGELALAMGPRIAGYGLPTICNCFWQKCPSPRSGTAETGVARWLA
jgi:hypothetical protein